ncbi:MAG: sigma factor [Tetrasphaera sp.]
MEPTAEERFRTLYAATYADVLAFARRRVGDHDGHDIAAEVYAVAWRRLRDIPADDPRPWLFGVARNILRGDARGRRRRRNSSPDNGRVAGFGHS